ncbi:S8 family serine peptidase [Streptomyces noursei]|uniref:S8 family peptidase n=1 Tax=Streptomyces TaxID=1883 RepID=UPI001F48A618|nr:S8 family serine peptidase [Streptomyces noursei]MCE4941903.1 S8 family serine peptidase [Streptomyces noursei]
MTCVDRHLALVNLARLMELGEGAPHVRVGLIDGMPALDHPDLARDRVRVLSASQVPLDVNQESCAHATFVAGVLAARRGSVAPAICPGCVLLVRPAFAPSKRGNGQTPTADPQELADAIIETVEARVRVINLSLALAQPSNTRNPGLEEALDHAAHRGVIIVVSAGNQGALGTSPLTRHPWVIPVVACDLGGRPMALSNLGNSIGRRGLAAPGARVTSLGAEGPPLTFQGTSAAAPFVTGAVALLWSQFPAAPAVEVRSVLTNTAAHRRKTVVPPLLDAWAAYQGLRMLREGDGSHD